MKSAFKSLSAWPLPAIYIPALVMAIELSIWAFLNLNGLGDPDWTTWLGSLFVAYGILYLTAMCCDGRSGRHIWVGAVGILIPWVAMLIYIPVVGLIKMSLSFVTLDWFFYGVRVGALCQILYVTIAATR